MVILAALFCDPIRIPRDAVDIFICKVAESTKTKKKKKDYLKSQTKSKPIDAPRS